MNEERLVEIETKIAFQESTMKDLSDTIYDQQKQIDALNETLKRLIDQIKGLSIISQGGEPEDEKPPHY